MRPTSWQAERARFPVLRTRAYLNAGSFGPLSERTLSVMAELRAREGSEGRAGRPYFDEMLAARERVRALIAAQIGAPPETVALTSSTTQGVHIVLAGLGLGPDDEVVTTDVEHFGLAGPLAASGARLCVAPIFGAPPERIADLVRAHVTPRTRLLALSAVSWLDGVVLPWRELRETTGVPVLVDGAQSVGALEVDATAADFYTVSGQKWLCGPDATGALYVRAPEALAPRLVSYPSQQAYDIGAGTWEPKPGAARFDPLFAPAASIAGLEAVLSELPAGRFVRARELAERFRAGLAEAGHDVVTPPGQATLVSFRLQGDAAAIVTALHERGVVIRELPTAGLLRASVGWWNDEDDLERLVGGLAEVG